MECWLTNGACCVQVLKWSDYCLPLACGPGQPYRAVAQASVDNFTRLGVAFIEDRLHLDDGLLPSKIVRMSPSLISLNILCNTCLVITLILAKW